MEGGGELRQKTMLARQYILPSLTAGPKLHLLFSIQYCHVAHYLTIATKNVSMISTLPFMLCIYSAFMYVRTYKYMSAYLITQLTA